MAIRQASLKEATKDGRRWYFYLWIKYPDGTRKFYNSAKFFTKKEAELEERKFNTTVDKQEYNATDMTFKDLYTEFYDYKKDKVKKTTLKTYIERIPRIQMLDNIKIKDFNIKDYLRWRNYINSLDITINTKNHYHKFLKNILNYGTKWHDFNFNSIYNKMEKFADPNAMPEEMKYYTYEEFKKFISVENNLRYRCVFETLYFCGLRKGELRGLTWKDIDFDEKTIRINKNVVEPTGRASEWIITTPKTKSSIRVIPMPDKLCNDLIYLKKNIKVYKNFKESWFVFGADNPISSDVISRRKTNLAKKSELHEIRIHDFRHSCASLLINNGANIMIVAKYLGHTKIDETLNTYSHLFKTKMDDVVNMINNLS